MKLYIKAWQTVINLATHIAYDEAGLQDLNGILYGPVREVYEVTDEVVEEMKLEFEKMHPDFRYDHMEVNIAD